jgi:hypothetical protein
MKCQYKVNPFTVLELEAPNSKEMFAAMAQVAEIFGSQFTMCGKCKDAKFVPRPVVRLNKAKESFYELHCTNPDCRARYAYGQGKDMKSIFPQRKFSKNHPQKGQYKPDNGWVVYKNAAEEEHHEDE